LQPRRHFARIASRRDLKRQPRRFDGAAALEHNNFEAGFGGEDRPVFLARDKSQSDDAKKIVDHPFNVGSRQR
jgi:hypothetical protein